MSPGPPGVQRVRCSALSAELGEPLAGSAPSAGRWLLLEQPGPWGRKAVLQSDLDAEVAAELDRCAKAAGIRVQLLRRGTRAAAPAPRTCSLASTEPGDAWLERHVLPTREAVLDLDLAALAAGRRTDPAAAYGAPLFAVCTHGRRDACCAEHGRPLARAIAAHRPGETWETSHLGGHRFAATFIALPAGLVFGRVPAAAGPGIAAAAARGEIDVGHLRGRAGLPPAAQVADVEVRRRERLTRLADVAVAGVEKLGAGLTAVDLRLADGRRLRARVRRASTGHPRPLSCGADAEDPGQLELAGLEELADPAGEREAAA
jgi:hypothetical protein